MKSTVRVFAAAVLLWVGLVVAASAQPIADILAASSWEGTYTCYQGDTGVVLTFSKVDDALVGEFAFHAIPGNPDVPSGRYAFAVDIADDGTITATQRYWITRPPDFVMVDFSGQLNDSGTQFSGTIAYDGCTAIAAEAVRQSGRRP